MFLTNIQKDGVTTVFVDDTYNIHMRKHYSFSIISLKSSTQDGFKTSHTTVGGDVTLM